MSGPAGEGGRPFPAPKLVLAADHRARGVFTVERYEDMLVALESALRHADGILATYRPLVDLKERGALDGGQSQYLSINRTGLAGSVFELDDRLVATVEGAAEAGFTGIKHMTRIDFDDPVTADALELLGRVIESSRREQLDALIEPLIWRDGGIARDVDSIVRAAVIAHDIGAPLLKVPVPDAAPGAARQDAVARIVTSVGVPVLFLGGPRTEGGATPMLGEARDVIEAGGHGMAVGRTIYQDPDPASVASQLRAIIEGGSAHTVTDGP